MSGRLRKMSLPALDAGPFIDKAKWERQMSMRADFDIPDTASQFWLRLFLGNQLACSKPRNLISA